MWACGAAGSAPEWHSGGHRFDPGQVHQPPLIIQPEVAHHSAEGATVGPSPKPSQYSPRPIQPEATSARFRRFAAGRTLASAFSMSGNRRVLYVLKNERNPPSYYTGLTSNLRDRLDAHNAGR